MHTQIPYVLPLFVAATVSVAFASFAWRRRSVPGAMPFVWLMLGIAEWTLAYALELWSVSLRAKLFSAQLEYIGIVIVPPAGLALALQYTSREKWATRRNMILLAVPSLLALAVIWTNSLHHLFWTNVRLNPNYPTGWKPDLGVAFWIWAVYAYSLLLAGAVLLLQAFLRSSSLYRGQAGALLIGALLPWISNAVTISGVTPFPGLDLTPFAFALSGLPLSWGLFRFQLLDIVPVARDAVIEEMNDGVIVLDKQNRIVDLNPAAVSIFGCSAKAAIGQPASQVLDRSIVLQTAQPFPDLIEQYPEVAETRLEIGLDEDATSSAFDLRISPLHNRRGRLTGRLIVLRDITERKRAEEALQEAHDELEMRVEERTAELAKANVELQTEIAGHMQAKEALQQRNRELALLNRASRAFVATLDLDVVLTTVLEEVRHVLNVIGCSIWLIDPDAEKLVCRQAIGHQREVVYGQQLALGEGIVGRVARSGKSLIVPDIQDDERHFKEGSQRSGPETRSVLSVPLRLKRDVIGVIQVVDTEIDRFGQTELMLLESLAATATVAIENARLYQELKSYTGQLEDRVLERTAQLQAQYARLDAILRSATDGIVVTDAQGNILDVNPVAQTWLTRTLSPEDSARLQGAVRDLARQTCVPSRGNQDQPATVLELTGLDLELKAAQISEPGVEEAAAIVDIHDVSHMKALDRMKSRFVTNISQEFRTPVTTLKLYIHLMQRQPEMWAEYLIPLAQEVEHQARLVEDILYISRIDAGRLEVKPRPTPLAELIKASITDHRELLHQRGLLLQQRPADPSETKCGPLALVDPEWMKRVVDNLMRNAIYYTPEGGKVTVSAEIREAENRAWATLSVSDTGIGIPEDELPHVFERFFRGEEAQLKQIPGTGLGLATAKEIVELHGGRVTVKSEVDAGSTFTVWLPRADNRD